jgi:hypothetical protein
MLAKLQGLKISTKLSVLVGGALLALCVMAAITVFAARQIQHLGDELYFENKQLLGMEMDVSIAIERAIADVHSAPSELDLERLKANQEHFHVLLNDAKRIVEERLAGRAAADVSAGGAKIVAAIEAFEVAAKSLRICSVFCPAGRHRGADLGGRSGRSRGASRVQAVSRGGGSNHRRKSGRHRNHDRRHDVDRGRPRRLPGDRSRRTRLCDRVSRCCQAAGLFSRDPMRSATPRAPSTASRPC